MLGKRQTIFSQSRKSKRLRLPDFFKPTRARFRGRLAQITAAAEARDISALQSKNMTGAWLCSAPKNYAY